MARNRGCGSPVLGIISGDMPENAHTPERKTTLATVLSVLHLTVLVIGVGGMFVMIGRRDQKLTDASTDIEKLASVINDLAKAQASAAVMDSVHAKELQSIQQRLVEIERKIR